MTDNTNGETPYEQAQMKYKKAQMKHKKAELEKIRWRLLFKLEKGELPAVVTTTSDVAKLLQGKIFGKDSPERKQLIADLGAHGVPEEKVRVYDLGDIHSKVKILP